MNLYPYQEQAWTDIFNRIEQQPQQHLLFQLPTGGGKTVIFAEIAKRFLSEQQGKVMILTHRLELCAQTSATLKKLGVKNKVIDSSVKQLPESDNFACYVAMVETLHNRIENGDIDVGGIGLLIIDEAHFNAFQKLLGKFAHATVLGVTATPLSSDCTAPLKENYEKLIIGASIGQLIEDGYLAKPTNWRYDVELNSLQTNGAGGDFTVSTSDELYSSAAMLDLLLHAYEAHAKGKKTLIFNNGIFTSKNVCQHFEQSGYPIRHLDNQTSPAERKNILQWFRKTKAAILTSVSILTTGFDEPAIQAVILNRATTSLSLYHQMIGRGSRRLPQKKTFSIIDLGNNTERFGEWQVSLDWQEIFDHPEAFQGMLANTATTTHLIPTGLRSKFPNSLEVAFDVQSAYEQAISQHQKPGTVIRQSLRQHVMMCVDNAATLTDALELTKELDKEIVWRVKQYAKCLGHVTTNYKEWLIQDYQRKLEIMVKKMMLRKSSKRLAG